MIQRHLQFVVGIFVLSAGIGPAFGQFDPDFPRKPQSTAEYWRALQFSIAQGKYDIAAEYLKGMLAAKPTEKDLIAIEDREGMAVFLNLRNIPKWNDDPKLNGEAKSNVEDLIQQVSTAVRKLRSDPDRIQRFLRNLSASVEEREYAIVELRKSGAAVMPYLVAAVQTGDVQERANILSILPLLEPDTVPPLLAAFDINKPILRAELIDVVAARPDILQLLAHTESDPRPALWYLAAQPEPVGKKARTLLQALLGVSSVNLPNPAVELTKAAEQIYHHKASFAKGAAAPQVWRFDGKQLISANLSLTEAEEYFGLRFARWAMEIDPTYEPARITFLSLALEKALERGGFEERPAKAAPNIHNLLATVSGETLYAILTKALAENHLTVAYGVTEIIGARAESTGARGNAPLPGEPRRNVDMVRGEPATLVRAVNSQDRRVALAAADALVRLPGLPRHQVCTRVVEVFRAALAAPPAGEAAAFRPTAILGDGDRIRSGILAEIVRQAGFDTIIVHTGRDLLKRLNEAADVDLILVDHGLAFPELPELLAQLRADFRYGKRPVFVTLSEDISKAILPDLNVRLDKLAGIVPQLQIRERSPIRIKLFFDALQVNAADLDDWLRDLKRDHPRVRVDRTAELRVYLAMDKLKDQPPELAQRVKELTQGILEITVNQESRTRITYIMDGAKPAPALFAARLDRLQRDYPVIAVSRELNSTIDLTSSFSTEIPREAFAKVERQIESYANVRLMRRPVTSEGFRDEFLSMQNPMTRPLSALERRQHQKRAIEALAKMATGVAPGYDVRPASNEIRAALRVDELASAAIQATGRLPFKEAQQDLAEYVLNAKRPAALRIQAAQELVRHIDAHTAAPLTDPQIQRFLQMEGDEKNADVQASVALIVGAIPRDRVLKNLADDAARDTWRKRLLQYRPAAPAPAPAPPPKAG